MMSCSSSSKMVPMCIARSAGCMELLWLCVGPISVLATVSDRERFFVAALPYLAPAELVMVVFWVVRVSSESAGDDIRSHERVDERVCRPACAICDV